MSELTRMRATAIFAEFYTQELRVSGSRKKVLGANKIKQFWRDQIRKNFVSGS